MDEGTGSYAYTSWDGVLPSLDMSNGALIEFVARENTGTAVNFSILLRAGGTWYISETTVTIQDTIVVGEPQLHTFDPAASTWETVDANTVAMLDAQADGDEAAIVGTGTTGITLTTELADVTGGGLLVPTSQERMPVQFDDIKWSQDPTLNDEPVVTINNNERWAYIVDYNPGTDTAPGTNWVYLEDGKGWQAITNAEAFDDDNGPSPLTYTWEATSYVGTETDEATALLAVEFNRKAGTDGVDENALDPNIVYNYRGTYTVTLTADDGEDSDTATLTTHVVANRVPTVTDIAGNLERIRYDGDILKLNPAISDDNYPVDVALTTQHIRYLSGPVGSMTFRYGSGASYRTSVNSFVGIGKGHPMVDSRSPEDPNVTFPAGVLGVYKFDLNNIPGVLTTVEAKFSIMSARGVTTTHIHAATYRDGIEWFEGNGHDETGGTPNPGLTFRWVNPADSFDIYISQTMQDVNTLDNAALVKTGVVGNEWFPEHDMIEFILSGDVDYGGVEEVYYWRVVAKSAVGPDAPSEMTSFTTGSNELIDNFGSDTNSDHLYTRAVGGEFVAGNGKATWTATGSAKIFMVNNSTGEPNKLGPADNGGTSLRIDYNDSVGIATATCVFAKTRDWSSAVNRASMRFQLLGLASNSERITVTVTDTSNTSDSVTFLADDDQTEEAMTKGSWNGFDAIDLSIADMAINHASIKSFSISVGDGAGSDKGTVWVDVIQIHRVRCLEKMIPYYFSAGDCAADVNELEVIASKWLRDLTPTTVLKGSAPSPVPVLHFDYETYASGTFTGVYGHTSTNAKGSATGQDTDVPTLSYASNSYSMRVNRTHRMETTSFTNLPTGSWTLSMWVKPDKVTGDQLNPDGSIIRQRPWRLRGGPSNSQTFMRMEIFDGDGDALMGGAGLTGANVNEDIDVLALESTWIHIAYVLDYENLSNALYVNGLKIDENINDEDIQPFPAIVGNMRVPHNNADKGFNGLIDELRLYDYALTHEQVLYLADEDSVLQPVLGVNMAGDLNGDETWNIVDLAELSASYHKDNVWWP